MISNEDRTGQPALEQRFGELVNKLRALPADGPAQPSSALKLQLYGLFRQARDGDAPGRSPGGIDFLGGLKHSAWLANRGMARDEAMRRYVEAIETFARERGVDI
jgi:diazepam-binding inhibitor (GABA receptor modulator, acyl-CoA-binding protein)